jgi:hypothetical protein
VDAGEVDAGVVASDGGDDGGVPDGGRVVDAGCPDFLCPEDQWQSSRTSLRPSPWTAAPGIIADSLDRFIVWTGYASQSSGRQRWELIECEKADGGFVEFTRTPDFGPEFEPRIAKGTLTDKWLGSRGYVRRAVEGQIPIEFNSCLRADGGVNDPYWYGLEVLAPDNVLLVGYPYTVCRWTPATGPVELVDPDSVQGRYYFYEAHRTAAGAEYVVGGDYVPDQGLARSVIMSSDGGAVSAPADTDSQLDFGWTDIDGVGNEAWVVSGSGLVAQLRPDGGFEAVFDAGFSLRALSVGGPGDVWAVGDNSTFAAHFDGGSWALVRLPSAGGRSDITWEQVRVTPDGAGLILSGYVSAGSPPTLKAVVHSYRRFGK